MAELNDKAVVDAFVLHLAANGHSGLTVDRRPDDDNRDSSDIDAIAGSFAIEHTSIDTIEGQRRDSSWFFQVVGPLEVRFKDSLRFRLRLLFPYDGIAKGQNWSAVRTALEHWISNEAHLLGEGVHQVSISGVPFEFKATKASDRPPGLFFVRVDPGDTSLPARLSSQLERKAAKLAPYKALGHTTVLLIESGDIALMNSGTMLHAIKTAFRSELPPGVDRIWYADTSIKTALEFSEFTSILVAS